MVLRTNERFSDQFGFFSRKDIEPGVIIEEGLLLTEAQVLDAYQEGVQIFRSIFGKTLNCEAVRSIFVRDGLAYRDLYGRYLRGIRAIYLFPGNINKDALDGGWTGVLGHEMGHPLLYDLMAEQELPEGLLEVPCEAFAQLAEMVYRAEGDQDILKSFCARSLRKRLLYGEVKGLYGYPNFEDKMFDMAQLNFIRSRYGFQVMAATVLLPTLITESDLFCTFSKTAAKSRLNRQKESIVTNLEEDFQREIGMGREELLMEARNFYELSQEELVKIA